MEGADQERFAGREQEALEGLAAMEVAAAACDETGGRSSLVHTSHF